MVKYNVKSAEVLNAADNFEMRLNWTLFTAEQDQRLWSDHNNVHWKPGEFLYTHPVIRGTPEEIIRDRNQFSLFEPSTGYWGNHPRPMIQEIDDAWELEFLVRCRSCEVAWEGPEIYCWMCGKPEEREPRTSWISAYRREWSDPIGHVENIENTMRGVNVEFVIDDEAMRAEWAHISDAMRNMSVQATVSAEHFRELFGLFDEPIPETQNDQGEVDE